MEDEVNGNNKGLFLLPKDRGVHCITFIQLNTKHNVLNTSVCTKPGVAIYKLDHVTSENEPGTDLIETLMHTSFCLNSILDFNTGRRKQQQLLI